MEGWCIKVRVFRSSSDLALARWRILSNSAKLLQWQTSPSPCQRLWTDRTTKARLFWLFAESWICVFRYCANFSSHIMFASATKVMGCYMLDVITHWRDVIAKVKHAYPHVSRTSYKFKHLIAAEVEASKLPWSCVDQIAHFLGIKLFPRPTAFPIHGLVPSAKVSSLKNTPTRKTHANGYMRMVSCLASRRFWAKSLHHTLHCWGICRCEMVLRGYSWVS